MSTNGRNASTQARDGTWQGGGFQAEGAGWQMGPGVRLLWAGWHETESWGGWQGAVMEGGEGLWVPDGGIWDFYPRGFLAVYSGALGLCRWV